MVSVAPAALCFICGHDELEIRRGHSRPAGRGAASDDLNASRSGPHIGENPLALHEV
jgi:hypothetical protein